MLRCRGRDNNSRDTLASMGYLLIWCHVWAIIPKTQAARPGVVARPYPGPTQHCAIPAPRHCEAPEPLVLVYVRLTASSDARTQTHTA